MQIRTILFTDNYLYFLSYSSIVKPKLIIITGTPTTGKSTLAIALAQKLKFERLDLHHYYKSISSGYNKKKQAYNIDKKKFMALVKTKIKNAKRGLIIDSHISHLLLSKIVDLCIVLTCSNLKLLQKRLKKRKYSKEKIRENLDAEIFQVCLMEAKEMGHKIITFNTSKDTLPKIISKIKLSRK